MYYEKENVYTHESTNPQIEYLTFLSQIINVAKVSKFSNYKFRRLTSLKEKEIEIYIASHVNLIGFFFITKWTNNKNVN